MIQITIILYSRFFFFPSLLVSSLGSCLLLFHNVYIAAIAPIGLLLFMTFSFGFVISVQIALLVVNRHLIILSNALIVILAISF
ncbi:hypothetical protein BC829DRAFT_409749, partial [Chytridium lagenaria]